MIVSTIRPCSGGGGPFYVVTEKDGIAIAVTTSIADASGVLDQIKADHLSASDKLAIKQIRVVTTLEIEPPPVEAA